MNEAASSVEPEVKTPFATVDDVAFERPQIQFPVFNNCSNITNCIRFFLINFIVLKHQKCQALKIGVCWFEAATYKKE